MKGKIFTTFLMAVMTVFLVTSFASAITVASSNDLTLSSTSSTITVAETDGVNQTISFTVNPTQIVVGTNTISFTTPSDLTFLAGGVAQTATISSTVSGLTSDLPFGEYTTTLTAASDDTSIPVADVAIPVRFVRDFCTLGEQGTTLGLEIDKIKIESDGEDDEEWRPLDTVTVEVQVENNGDDDIDDVFVELGLFDSSGKNVVDDLDFADSDEEELDLGNIKDDKDDEGVFEFQVPADFEDGSYKLAVKVYSDDLGENTLCLTAHDDLNDAYFQDIDVDRDSDNPIIVDDIVLSVNQATAGDKVTAIFKVWNVGTSDEDQVKINIRNDDLGINVQEEIKQGIDEGEGQELELSFTVPSGLDDGLYSIVFTADFDYDSKEDTYDDASEDSWSAFLKVAGASAPAALNIEIAATLDSEAVAGQEMIVSSTITNNEDETKTFVIDAKDFNDWATLDSISDRLLTLAPGQSADVEFTFNVDKGVSGEESFVIEVLSGEQLEQREVAVNVESGGLFGSLGGDSNLIWIIGIINVVLIILIIVVAVRLSTR